MRILVTGASGFVGRHLVASLRGSGNRVVCLQRGAGDDADDRAQGPADIADLDTWPDWPAGIDAVVHLAALNPSRGQSVTPDALTRANVAGTAALARRARREGVGRIVFVSTSNVHAPAPHAIRESDVLRPQSAYARSKAEAETSFWRELEGSATLGCVLRPAPVYGAGGRGNVAALARLARLSVPLPIEGLGGARSLLAIEHLVSAIELCLTSDGAAGQTFLVADDAPQTLADIARALRHGWNRPERLMALPAALRRVLTAKLAHTGRLGDFVLDAGHLKDRTGWRPRESTAARLSQMARNGEI